MTPIHPPTRGTTIIGDPTRGTARGEEQDWDAESQARTPGTDRPLWTYERVDRPGTPWVVIYGPTGQEEPVTSLPAGRRWTAGPDAVEELWARAGQVITDRGRTAAVVLRRVGGLLRPVEEDPAVCATRVAAARRCFAIHAGRMLPAGGITPEAVCPCGGHLAWRTAGWVHVDACADCWTPRTGWVDGPCPRPEPHPVCDVPEPERCGHHRCPAPASLTQHPCGADRENCCGCCHGEDQS